MSVTDDIIDCPLPKKILGCANDLWVIMPCFIRNFRLKKLVLKTSHQ